MPCRQAGRRASDSQTPPPISASPDKRPEQFGARGLHEPGAADAGRDRPGAIAERRQQHRHDAHDGELPARRQRRIDELRQERREERDRLRIGERDQDAAPEIDAAGGGAALPLPALRQAWMPSQIEIGGARPAQHLEQHRGVRQHPAQAERNGADQQRVAERRARDRDERRAHALARAGRDHQRHDRTRRHHQDHGDQQEGREQFPVHDHYSIPFVPAKAGIQPFLPCSWQLGPRFRGDERTWRCSARYPPLSSPSSESRSTETTRSSSAVSNTITPCVERPAMRMPSTRRADQLAAVGDQHDLVARPRPGTRRPARPVLPVTDIATMPLPPRPVVRYS